MGRTKFSFKERQEFWINRYGFKRQTFPPGKRKVSFLDNRMGSKEKGNLQFTETALPAGFPAKTGFNVSMDAMEIDEQRGRQEQRAQYKQRRASNPPKPIKKSFAPHHECRTFLKQINFKFLIFIDNIQMGEKVKRNPFSFRWSWRF
ncbi:MAG: hypothetical protein LJE96_07215 [Deltaproteobacteria bacterium]|nr:hypothetical protein [Deltaproteobacteria bacterium]